MSAIEGQSSRTATAFDRMEWPTAFSAVAYGVRIGVRTNDPALANDLALHLPPGATCAAFTECERVYSLIVDPDDRSGKPPKKALYVDNRLLARRSLIAVVLRAFEADVQLHVAEMSPDYVFVHAGVVGWRGQGILMPGRSFSGKTTLVAELIRAGADYYSDEYAVLDLAGCVHPYARPLAIRDQGGGFSKHPVDTLGGRAGKDALPVALVVLSEYRSGGVWTPSPLSAGNCVLALLANTVSARRIPEVAMATLRQIASRAHAVSSERGEASQVVQPLFDLATLGLTRTQE